MMDMTVPFDQVLGLRRRSEDTPVIETLDNFLFRSINHPYHLQKAIIMARYHTLIFMGILACGLYPLISKSSAFHPSIFPS